MHQAHAETPAMAETGYNNKVCSDEQKEGVIQ